MLGPQRSTHLHAAMRSRNADAILSYPAMSRLHPTCPRCGALSWQATRMPSLGKGRVARRAVTDHRAAERTVACEGFTIHDPVRRSSWLARDIFADGRKIGIEITDGTVKRVEPGDGGLAEDVTHQGHITRVVAHQLGFSVIIPLADAASQGRKPGCQGRYCPDRWTSQRGTRAGCRIS